MSTAHLKTLLKMAEAKETKGSYSLPEGTTISLHLASQGASVAVGKIVELKIEDDHLLLKTIKGDRVLVPTEAVLFASVAPGSVDDRRAGFR